MRHVPRFDRLRTGLADPCIRAGGGSQKIDLARTISRRVATEPFLVQVGLRVLNLLCGQRVRVDDHLAEPLPALIPVGLAVHASESRRLVSGTVKCGGHHVRSPRARHRTL